MKLMLLVSIVRSYAINLKVVASTSVKKFVARLIESLDLLVIHRLNICVRLFAIRNYLVKSMTAQIFVTKVSANHANGFQLNQFTVLVA
jgi:hypothetical protein